MRCNAIQRGRACERLAEQATDGKDEKHETKAETEPDTSQCRTTTYMLPVYGRRPGPAIRAGRYVDRDRAAR
jgi:hypothetical protein